MNSEVLNVEHLKVYLYLFRYMFDGINSTMKKFTTIIITVIVCSFLVINFFLRPSQLTHINSSTITGLAMMREMARGSMTYEDAIVNTNPTLIEFYANWCTTCQSMSPILKELKKNYGEKINFVMIDIDTLENQQLVEKYAVAGVPQWNILNQEGKIVEQFMGKIPQPILESSLLAINKPEHNLDLISLTN